MNTYLKILSLTLLYSLPVWAQGGLLVVQQEMQEVAADQANPPLQMTKAHAHEQMNLIMSEARNLLRNPHILSAQDLWLQAVNLRTRYAILKELSQGNDFTKLRHDLSKREVGKHVNTVFIMAYQQKLSVFLSGISPAAGALSPLQAQELQELQNFE